MVPSPAKRREAGSMPSTPSRTAVPRDGTKTTLGRPSFASPTKASIAKHNPQLLDRPRSAGTDAAKPQGKENAPLAVVGESIIDVPGTGGEEEMQVGGLQIPGITDQNTAPRPTTTPVTIQTAGTTRPAEGGFSAPPRRRSRTPGKERPAERESLAPRTAPPAVIQAEPVPIPESGLSNTFQSSVTAKSPIIQEPQTNNPVSKQGLPPDPFRKAGLRRSPVSSQPINSHLVPETIEEEPELPLTPTQLGLTDPVVTTPPSGIHNTPSKRPKKRPRGGKHKSSPLKPRVEPDIPPEIVQRAKRRRIADVEPKRVVHYDPHAEKKKIRDQLLEEVIRLEADITLAERENERQRLQHRSRKQNLEEPPNPDEILDLLTRSTTSSPVTPHKQPTVLQTINSFLPFAKRRRPPPTPPQQDTLPANHLPLIAPNPLPHLKLFTPLTFTSSIFILPPTPPSSPRPSTAIFQSHTITARAASGLLTARYSMIVNTTTFAITSLVIERLDAAAEPELGVWMRKRAADGVLGRDVNAICWAMGRWLDVAMQRARFWLALEAELGTEGGRRESGQRLGKGKKASIEDEEEEEIEFSNQKWTRRQLLPHMGRTEDILANSRVELRVEWTIGFDWTGEAESKISASARVPSSWQQADTRNSFTKVPQTFEMLVKTRGPLAATRTIVALLMKD